MEPCPPVEAGPGRVVLATVTHYNSFVLRLWVTGLDEPLEPTAEHPLYSEDRQAWVPAGELRVGELLRTAAGPAAVAAVERRPGTHRVYNLEVEGEHCYFVGASGVLSHNVVGCILRVAAQYGAGLGGAELQHVAAAPAAQDWLDEYPQPLHYRLHYGERISGRLRAQQFNVRAARRVCRKHYENR